VALEFSKPTNLLTIASTPGAPPRSARLAAHYWSANSVESSSTHTDGCEQPFGQRLIGNCRSARGDERAFEDDGEATIWFEPLDWL
jgi:hypothetical protein